MNNTENQNDTCNTSLCGGGCLLSKTTLDIEALRDSGELEILEDSGYIMLSSRSGGGILFPLALLPEGTQPGDKIEIILRRFIDD